jgi:hypothetical protein
MRLRPLAVQSRPTLKYKYKYTNTKEKEQGTQNKGKTRLAFRSYTSATSNTENNRKPAHGVPGCQFGANGNDAQWPMAMNGQFRAVAGYSRLWA